MKSNIALLSLFYTLHIVTVSGRVRRDLEDSSEGGLTGSTSGYNGSTEVSGRVRRDLEGSSEEGVNGFNIGFDGSNEGVNSKGTGGGSGGGIGGTGGGSGGGAGGTSTKWNSRKLLQNVSGSRVIGGTSNSSSIGLRVENSINELLSTVSGGSLSLKNFGLTSGSISGLLSNNTINSKSFITSILESPITLTRSAIQYTINFVWSLITFQFKVLKLPFSIFSSVFSLMRSIIAQVLSSILNGFMKVTQINADVVAKGVGGVKSLVGFVVRSLANVQISGLQATFGVVGFSRDQVVAVGKGIIQLFMGAIKVFGKILTDGVQFVQLDKIVQLPVIRNIVGIFMGGYTYGLKITSQQINELSQFVFNIINQNQDFFIPIYHRILNFVLAISDAIKRIMNGGSIQVKFRAPY